MDLNYAISILEYNQKWEASNKKKKQIKPEVVSKALQTVINKVKSLPKENKKQRLDGFDDNSTIAEIRQYLSKSWEKGCICPSCKQNVKLYKIKIRASMVKYLVKLYKLSISNLKTSYHVEKDIEVPLSVGGSWAKLRWWGLIKEIPKNENSKGRTSGYWQITELGRKFVLEEAKVPEYVMLYNSNCYGESGEEVSIRDCFKKGVDFDKLMNS